MTARPSALPLAPADVVLDELVDALASGRLRFHQLPVGLPASAAALVRRRAIERMRGIDLTHIGHHSFDVERASTRNCENLFGVAQIPMGLVGPLAIRGDEVNEEVYVPLATTEGALVASTNRGCSAIRAAGGVRVHVEDVGMTRAPVFHTGGIDETRKFLAWVEEHLEQMREIAASTSRHLHLLDIKPFAFSTSVYLRFRFSSGDAMGMNMATIACDRIVREYIEVKTGIHCVALSGNFCIDKKPASVNFQEGRGKRIWAEVLLPEEVLHDVLKTSAVALVEVQYHKNLLGSIAAGAKGFNAHFANSVAAFFIATGQDLAHVVGASQGVTCIEERPNHAAHFSIFLPDTPLGAVGGGTGLDTQSEALALLGVAPDPARPGTAVRRLAEILGAVVLASELSLMAAFTSHDLARAHERLGRGRLPEELAGG